MNTVFDKDLVEISEIVKFEMLKRKKMITTIGQNQEKVVNIILNFVKNNDGTWLDNKNVWIENNFDDLIKVAYKMKEKFPDIETKNYYILENVLDFEPYSYITECLKLTTFYDHCIPRFSFGSVGGFGFESSFEYGV